MIAKLASGAALVAGVVAAAACVPPEAAPRASATTLASARGEDLATPRAAAEFDGGEPAQTLARADAGPDGPCEAYCSAVIAGCRGADAPYPSVATCLAACRALDPAGVGCRSAYAIRARDGEVGACAAAGASGGGRCGDRCASFCALVARACGGVADPPFADEATCLGACGEGRDFAFDPSRPERDAADALDDLNCRQARLLDALLDGVPGNAARVCPELGARTHPRATCVM